MTETQTDDAPAQYKPDEKYTVRLLMSLDADSPVEAVEQFIEQIVSFGLRGFMYRVVETATEKVLLVQEGTVMAEEEMLAAAAALEDEGDPDGG